MVSALDLTESILFTGSSVVFQILYAVQMRWGRRRAELQRLKTGRYKPGGEAESGGNSVYGGFAFYIHRFGFVLATIGVLFSLDPVQSYGLFPALVVILVKNIGLAVLVSTGILWFYWSVRAICGPLRIEVPRPVVWFFSYPVIYFVVTIVGDTLSIQRDKYMYQAYGTATLTAGFMSYLPLCLFVYISMRRALSSSLKLSAKPAAAPPPLTAAAVTVTSAAVVVTPPPPPPPLPNLPTDTPPVTSTPVTVPAAHSLTVTAPTLVLPSTPRGGGSTPTAATPTAAPGRAKPSAGAANDPSDFARRALRSLTIFSIISSLVALITLILTLQTLLRQTGSAKDEPASADRGSSTSTLMGQLLLANVWNGILCWYSWQPAPATTPPAAAASAIASAPARTPKPAFGVERSTGTATGIGAAGAAPSRNRFDFHPPNGSAAGSADPMTNAPSAVVVSIRT